MSYVDVLERHGIKGSDAQTALRCFEQRGGLLGAHEALAKHFGSDAVRVALVLLRETP